MEEEEKSSAADKEKEKKEETKVEKKEDASPPEETQGKNAPKSDKMKRKEAFLKWALKPRLYSDPTANWGYTASKGEYVFGHRLHAIAALGEDGELLPLRYDLEPANVQDGPMAVTGVSRLLRALKKRGIPLRFKRLIADKGYDCLAFHRFLVRRNIDPVIPLRAKEEEGEEREDTPSSIGDVRLSENGKPLCEANLEMRHHGFNKDRQTHVFNCPCKRPGREDGKAVWRAHVKDCPNGTLCEPESKMGPMQYIPIGYDPRMFPAIPRDSERFKEEYKKRSNVERLFSQFKGPDEAPYRRDYILHAIATMHGIVLHLKAAAKKFFGENPTRERLLEWQRHLDSIST